MRFETKKFKLVVSYKFILAIAALIEVCRQHTNYSTESSCSQQGLFGLFNILPL